MKKNIMCEEQIEKAKPQDHHLLSLGMPHDDRFFYPHLTCIIDSYTRLAFKKSLEPSHGVLHY